MARAVTSTIQNETTAKRVYPCVLVEMLFVSGIQRVWSGSGTKTWNGYTWQGLGKFAAISPLTESADVVAQGYTLKLSAVPVANLNQALTECRQGNPVRIYFGFMDGPHAGSNVLADPYLYGGRMDVPVIDDDDQTAEISLTVESRLVDLQRNRERRYTPEDQKIDYSSDLGFDFVAQLQEWNGVWGKGNAAPAARGANSPGPGFSGGVRNGDPGFGGGQGF